MTGGANAAWALLAEGLAAGEDRAAYLFDGATLTYSELRDRALQTARFFAASGLAPGSRVLFALPDTPGFVSAFLGAMFAGLCPVPVNTTLKADEYRFLLEDSGAGLLLTVPGHAASDAATGICPTAFCDHAGPLEGQAHAPAFAPLPPDDARPGFMLYSSGSTGRPKGVPHRQEDLLIPARTWGQTLGLTRQDMVFSTSKLFFAYGLLASLALPLAAGATTVLFPGKPGPGDVFDIFERHKPTAFFGVPTLYNALIRVFEPSMKPHVPALCYSAGEALPPLLHEEWARLTGREILDGIGSTEAFNVFLGSRRGQSRPGSAGQPVQGFEVRLVDDEGRDAPAGSDGNLLIRGPGLCRAYWNRPDKTRETMLPDGWLRTGDVFAAVDGFYFHRGRSDDMLKSGGQWVSPVRVEEELLRHPAVAECAVAARRVNGLDVVCAFVVPAPGVTADKALTLEWRRFLRERLPEHMCPALFECLTELPKTATGKVQRFMLRQG